MKYTIEHGFYGCDTGCCGYRLTSTAGEEWTFDHPSDNDSTDEDLRTFAREAFGLGPDDEIAIGEWRSCSL